MCLPAEWFKAPLDRRGSSAWHWLGSGSRGRSKTGSTLSPPPPALAVAFIRPSDMSFLFGGGGGGGGFQVMMNMYNGQLLMNDGNPPELECSCGTEFGEYMTKALDAPFPYDGTAPSSRSVTTVWRGRRLRVLLEADGDWQTGRVVKFEQYNMGPFSRDTHWIVSVRFDDAVAASALRRREPSHAADSADAGADASESAGQRQLDAPPSGNGRDERLFAHQTAQEAKESIDDLSYRELQSGLKNVGLPATGRKDVLAARLYEAWLNDAEETWDAEDEDAAEEAAEAAAEVAEVERAVAEVEEAASAGGHGGRGRSPSPSPGPRQPPILPVDFAVLRANVRVGGTLKDPREGREGLLLSFQWLDPPVPDLSLGDGVSCPTCRQVQPPTAGEEIAPEALCVGECPVCLCEARDCLTLQCSHLVCQSCWKKWVAVDTVGDQAHGGDENEPEEPDGSELSQEALQAERKILYDEMVRQTGAAPHIQGGDSTTCPHCANIADIVDESITSMETDDSGGRNGLRRLRRRLLTKPIIISMSDHIRNVAMRYGSIALMQVFTEVIALRENCIATEIERGEIERGGSEAKLDEEARKKAVDSWTKTFCCRIGEVYEDQGKFARAIPWYKRCCAISASERYGIADHCHDFSNLGVAQKRAGLLVEALASYDMAIAIVGPGDEECSIAELNRQTLIKEMRHWTGMACEYDFDDALEDSIWERLNENSLPHNQLPMGYYSEQQKAALPLDREVAASAAKQRKLLLVRAWRYVKTVMKRTPSRTTIYAATFIATFVVLILTMCVLVRSVDVFIFNEWSAPRAVVTVVAVTLLLDPCSCDNLLQVFYCGLPTVNEYIDATHIVELRRVLSAVKLAVWLLHLVIPLWLQYMQTVASYIGSPTVWPVHEVLVLANVGAVVAFSAGTLRLATHTPWRLAAGAHAVAAAAIVFLLIKCQGDFLMGAPLITCGGETGGDSVPGGSCVTLLTGANSGIGYATAHSLATQGHTVLLACRSQSRCDDAAASIVAAVGGTSGERVVPLGGLELSSLASVAAWVAAQDSALPTIDVLFLNAGFTPRPGALTADGYEAGLGAIFKIMSKCIHTSCSS